MLPAGKMHKKARFSKCSAGNEKRRVGTRRARKLVSTETEVYDAQLNPLPQLEAEGAPQGIADEPLTDAANVESCFSELLDLQKGQFTASSA